MEAIKKKSHWKIIFGCFLFEISAKVETLHKKRNHERIGENVVVT
jgi:hypothetical protein